MAFPSWLLCLYFAVPPSASKPLTLDVAHTFSLLAPEFSQVKKGIAEVLPGGVGAVGRGALGMWESLNQGSLSSAEVCFF